MTTMTFDTIDGEVKAIERYDSYDGETFYDCYLSNSKGNDIYLGESHSNERSDIEMDINDLLEDFWHYYLGK